MNPVQAAYIFKALLIIFSFVDNIQLSPVTEEEPQQQTVENPTASPQCPSASPSIPSTVSILSSPGSSLPDGFNIPSKWRPSIMSAMKEQKLTSDIRNEIVRDLVTHMYGFAQKPSNYLCKFVAQRLILKYMFMRDSKGTGYVSSST